MVWLYVTSWGVNSVDIVVCIGLCVYLFVIVLLGMRMRAGFVDFV